MNSTTKGLVIREQTTGENDRLVTLLTADHGLVRAFVRGGKQLKNRRAAATSLFCYGEFALYRGRDARSEERRVGKECRSRWSPYH